MASKRRGGFRPPELRGTLGTLLRTTSDVVRGALERGAREGRARFDDLRSSRRRHDALAELGAIVLDLVRRGEIDLAELPEARDLVREIDDLDAHDEAEPATVRPSTRRRFDDRGPPASDPVDPDDDGTISSITSGASRAAARAARPTVPDRPRPETPSTRAPTKPMKGIWRPLLDDTSPAPDHGDHASHSERPTVPDRRPPTEAALRAARSGSSTTTAVPPVPSAAASAPASAAAFADRALRRTATASDRASAERTGASDRTTGAPRDIAEPAGGDDHAGGHDDEPGGHHGEPRGWLPPRDPDRKGGIRFDEDDLSDYMHPDDVPPRSPPREPGDGDP